MRFKICLFVLVFSAIDNMYPQNVSFTSSLVCQGDSTVLNAVTDIPPANIASYGWDLNGDGYYTDGYGKTLKAVFDSSGTFHIGVEIQTTDGKSYRSPDSLVLVIYPLPVAGFTAGPFCDSARVNFKSNSTIGSGSITLWHWKVTSGGITDTSGTSEAVFSKLSLGSLSVELTVVSDKGCSAEKTSLDTIHESPRVSITPANACNGDSAYITKQCQLTDGSSAMFTWNMGDGSQVLSRGNIAHLYQQPGTYKINILATTNFGCTGTDSAGIVIYQLPDLLVTATKDSVATIGDTVVLDATGDFASFKWNDSIAAGTINVFKSGKYTVVAVAANGCTATKSVNVVFNQKTASNTPQVYLPNEIITPNGDGVNETLVFSNINLAENNHLIVFDKWGREVANFKAYQNNWKCDYNGKILETGAYFYVLITPDSTIKGCFNILK